ncbi:DUF7010 family protein [Streptomyces montanisoli]|uniref:Uncharacterized protein n=1 Tax=Streptomyces montanisoli TaxID=2798581 RepID=A0A940RUN5_9ACTN|nr:hypothetical protein [Streptomyces montanisoli]MBP0457405.1 hypothetical protein [Streptomyces montanisoli]
MDSTTGRAEAAAAPHPAELRGRAAGTGIMAFFALAWTGWGTTGVPAGTGKALVGAGAVVTVVFFVLAVRLHRSAALLPVPTDDPLTEQAVRGTGRRFGVVLGLEWGACGVIAAVLGATGHPEAIPALIALIVGLHFLPLATLFHVDGYRVTGWVMCAVAVAGALLAILTSTRALWAAVPGLGSALILYLTSAYLVRTAPRAATYAAAA